MLLVGISCHLAIKRSNFPLPAQSCNMCAADNHIFLAYILSMGTHLFKKWKTMTHHENTLKKLRRTSRNHEKPSATLQYVSTLLCNIFLLSGLWNIAQGGDPLYADVNHSGRCYRLEWSIEWFFRLKSLPNLSRSNHKNLFGQFFSYFGCENCHFLKAFSYVHLGERPIGWQ